jgi:quercetin dioxygenase-like cupin family protein
MEHTGATQIVHCSSGDPARVQQLGPYQIEALLTPEQERAGTVYRVRIAPGQRTSISYHKVAEEYYYVLAGRGTAILDGRAHSIQAGDFLRLPPGTTHGFVTTDEALELLDVHTPGCRPDRDTFFVDVTPLGFREG